MSYNEEYRASQHSCHYTPRHSNCGCARNTVISHKNRNITQNERMVRDNDCSCNNDTEERIVTAPQCECQRTTRENTSCPNTICTTVPVEEGCVDTYPIAMAYVPMQQWRELYDPTSGHSRGTIFRELDLEWYPINCRKGNCNDKR